MVPKRHFRDEGDGEFAAQDSKRRPIFKTWVVDFSLSLIVSSLRYL